MKDLVEIIFDPIKGLKSVRSSLLAILLKWWDTHPLPWNEVDSITQCMMQMMAFKIRSLEVSLEGMPLVPNGKPQTLYVDSSTAAAIVRGIYEMAFIYHNIFISTDNENERDILLNIWKIKGYNNRNSIPIPDEMIGQKQQNAEMIETLKDRIRETLRRMNIESSAVDQIEDIIKKGNNLKGYQFVKENGIITKIRQLNFADADSFFNSGYQKGTYTFLSYQSHPSYLSIEQFGKINNPKQFIDDNICFLMPACFCATKFANDACEILSDGLKIKNEVVPDFRATINFFNSI